MSVTVEQEAYEMPSDNKKIMLKIDDVHLHSCGVFSNVYRGVLREPCEKQIAIKKTWPEKGERNFEFIFLTGRERMKHKNIIQMIYAFSHNYGNKVCESYVFDFLPQTLADVIKTKLTDIDIRIYTWQIFCGLKYLEEHCVIHRDLKPVNVLVDHSNGVLKISDFGSSKVHVKNRSSNFYQVTRFYRPPELLMKATDYDTSVDIWSAGCVVAEMIKRQVVFPGRDSAHEFKLHCRCFGAPSEVDVKAMKAPDRLEPEYARFTKGYGLARILPDSNPDQIKFLNKVLIYNPDKRLRGREALRDDFFKPLFKNGATRFNDQPISQIINAEDIRRSEVEDGSSKRLALLTLAMRQPKDQGIPLCEKSNSYENVAVRRSTLVPKEQRMAREQRSKEDNSREDHSNDKKAQFSYDEHPSDQFGRILRGKKSIGNITKKKSCESLMQKKSNESLNQKKSNESLNQKKSTESLTQKKSMESLRNRNKSVKNQKKPPQSLLRNPEPNL